ncbi:unnamed protein product, partial [Penicillium nalgiovense]
RRLATSTLIHRTEGFSMAKDHTRRGAARGTTITKTGASRSCASSPSARSTVSTSKADRNALKAVGNHKKPYPTAKRRRKKDHEATHRKCLDVMDQI